MNYLILPLLSSGVLGLLMLVWSTLRAPNGYEDENGFHLSTPVQAPSESQPVARPASSV